MRTDTGTSLLEVVMALVVLGLGTSGLVAGSSGLARAVLHGQTGARVAAHAASRLEAVRTLYLDGRPDCRVPAGGSITYPDGLIERWWVAGDGARIDVALGLVRSGGRVDSVSLAIRCR